MWPFKKNVEPDLDSENNKQLKRLRDAESFAPIESFIKYPKIKMLVVDHHKLEDNYTMICGQPYPDYYYSPGLNVVWMNSVNNLQR